MTAYISFDAHPDNLKFRVGSDQANVWLWLYMNDEDRAGRRSFGCIHLGSEDPRCILDRIEAAIQEHEESS